MKIFTNSAHQIKAVHVNDSHEELTEIEVEDSFLSNYCDTVKCGFCYEKWTDSDGTECLSVYPYKDLNILESIQSEHDLTQLKVNEAAPAAVMLAVKFAAESFTDKQALQVKELYPEWKAGCNYKEGDRLNHGGKLYRVLKSHTSQESWEPGQETASLFTVIDVEHAGTADDPIPASVNMVYYKDKYYVEDGVLYRCTRDSEIPLQYLPSQLLGQYFETAQVEKEAMK